MKKRIFLSLALLIVPFLKQEKKYTSILVVGDSLCCYTGGWQDQVAKSKSSKIDNISKGGKRCSWMLQTLQNHLSTKANYSHCFIYGGCNDAYSYVNLDSSISQIQKMVNLCIKNGIEPVVIVGYDPTKVQVRTPYDEKTTQFHRNRYVLLQDKMVKKLVNCKIVPKDTTVTRADSDDGLHLKSSGHKKFAKWVNEHL